MKSGDVARLFNPNFFRVQNCMKFGKTVTKSRYIDLNYKVLLNKKKGNIYGTNFVFLMAIKNMSP